MARLLFAAVAATVGMTALSAADPGPPAAGNWPHWRGPRADGTAPAADPPLAWDAATNVRWKASLPGRGSASPVVWGDQVFVLSAAETDRRPAPEELPKPDPRFEARTRPPARYYRFVVSSFDRATGKLRWERTAAEAVPHEGHHETHSYAGGSPTTDGVRVYASFGSFGTFAFGLDGTPIWSRDFGRLRTRLGWGEAVTPVVRGGVVLLNLDQEADSKLVCLDAATGATRWETAREERSTWTTPLVVEHAGVTQVVLNGTKRVRSYDLATGKELWAAGGMTVNAIPSVVADGSAVYAVSGYQGSAAVAVPLTATGDLGAAGAVLWRYGKGTPYVPSPLLLDGRLYFTQGNGQQLTVLDAATGKPVVNAERLPGVTSFYASPVAAAGRVYFVDRQGTTVVLKAGADAVEVLATNKLGDPVDATPAPAGKQLFLRGAKFLWCLEGS